MTSPETDVVRVLHGFIARDGSLALWAETDAPARASAAAELVAQDAPTGSSPADLDPPGPPTSTPAPPGRSSSGTPGRGRRESVPEHGFALAAEALPEGERRAPATLLLPSTGAGPLPSPQLGLPPRRGRPRLRPWALGSVTAPFVDDDLADRFGARAAPSLQWLVELSAFAADLVDRGRVLPGMVFDGAQPRARWRPVLAGPDAARHADLLRRMPAAVR
ncbi:MAG TPA: hypothetical protein VGP57_24750, partial [Actinoplanes sp.]|nr:hypothetical protein [Actinoplanes sp.]